jgi:hypothetical protein
MKMRVIVKDDQVGSTLELTGSIAQLATGPLKKSMDAFYHELSKLMKNDPELPTGTMPITRPIHTEQQFTMSDRKMVILVLVGVGAIALTSLVFRISEFALAILVIPVVYFLVRRSMKNTPGE